MTPPAPPAATIYAPATAAGRAAVGIVRVSGPLAGEACRGLTRRPALPPPRRATLRRLVDGGGEPIDDAVLLWMPGPGSFTGEDVLEIQHHGGPAVRGVVLEALGGVPGLRPAAPGEFTRQAFLNGRLDLTEAEGLADLVEAATRAQARQALRQMDGALGRRVEAWRAVVLDALARAEAEIDFGAEEGDVPDDAALAGVRGRLEALAGELDRAETEGSRGERLRAGVVVAVVGPPNAGKSSLVNLLARREVAIVTPHPGTTRDVIEVHLDLGGVPVTLLDTAGLREAADPVEREGVERARRRAAQADAVVAVVAADHGPEGEAQAFAARDLLVINKVDLVRPAGPPDAGRLLVSCATGEGVDELVGRLTRLAGGLALAQGDAVFTRERHRAALRECRDALGRVLEVAPGVEAGLVAEDLRLAAQALGRITGRVGVEEILDRIFATFCVGK